MAPKLVTTFSFFSNRRSKRSNPWISAEAMRLVRAGGFRVEQAGDCQSPRSLEEAILEGTLAAHTVTAA